eukprot:TRINITY_DN3585_c0_g1_i1.p1 TRINITY_DN3585_c0_g1~~TRINITY_DN3585_c0_g1_i1.p1  ORF type:complete len:260 (+),score=64.95 TRINITY_DN3585_c0_g1_i1:60-839(+)
MLTALLAVAMVTAQPGPPPQWMHDMTAKMTHLYNAGDYTGLQGVYNPGAELIPPSAGKFILGTGVGAFYKSLADGGVKGLAWTPVLACKEGDSLYHEIGETKVDGKVTKLYRRWVNINSVWEIAFDSTVIGDEASAVGQATAVPSWLIAMDHHFAAMYNAKNFSGVASVYNPGAQLIPPTADTYLLQSQLQAFFSGAYSNGLRNLTLTPTTTYLENPTLLHEIGVVTDSTGSGPYYVRWIQVGSVWQIAFDIMSIGGKL